MPEVNDPREKTLIWSLLAVVILLGAGVRFYHLGRWSIVDDETYTADHALGKPLLVNGQPVKGAFSPIFFGLTGVAVKTLGMSGVSLRLVAAVFGVLGIPALYLLASSLFGRRAGLLAALFLAFNHWLAWYSQFARFYTMVFFVGCLVLWLAYRSLEDDKPWMALLAGLVVAVSDYVNLTCYIVAAGWMGYLVILFLMPSLRPRGYRLKNILLFFIPACFPPVRELASSWLVRWAKNDVVPVETWGTNPLHLIQSQGYYIGVPIILLGCVATLLLLRDKDRRAWIALVCLYGMFVVFSVASFKVFLNDRYLMSVAPLYFCLGGYACARLLGAEDKTIRWLGTAVVAAIVALNGPSLMSNLRDGNRLDIRPATEYVLAHAKADEPIVLGGGLLYHYFTKDDPRLLWLGDTLWGTGWDAPKLSEWAQSTERMWFVVGYRRQGLPEELRIWLDKHTRVVARWKKPRLDFHDNTMAVYLFEPEKAGAGQAAGDQPKSE